MGPEELHPWVLRELSKDVAKPLPTLFKKSWQSSDLKRRNITPMIKKRKWKRLRELQPSQSQPPHPVFILHVFLKVELL